MATFTYTRDRPNPPNDPSTDAPDMQTNCNSIDDLINVDHYSFGESNKDGSHRQVTLTNSAAPGLGVGDGVLYAALLNANSWPAWQNAAGALPLIHRSPVAANNGYAAIPGSLLLQWGRNTAVTSGSFASGSAAGTVTFATANIAFSSACFFVICVPFYTTTAPNGSGSVNVDNASLSATAFNWKFNSNSGSYTGFYWFAIGV